MSEGVSTQTSTQELTIDNSLELASQYIREGKMHIAESIYQQMLAQQPNMPMIHNAYAAFKAQQGELPQALTAIKQAVALMPTNPIFLRNLGIIQGELGEFAAASEALGQSIAHDSQAPESYFFMAEIQLRSGFKNEALNYYEQALQCPKLNDNLKLVILQKTSNLYSYFKQWQQANAACEQALQYAPNDLGLKLRIAWNHRLAGDIEQAITLYKNILAEDPKQVQACRALLETCASICDWSAWDATLTKVSEEIAVMPTSRSFQFQLMRLPFGADVYFKHAHNISMALAQQIQPIKQATNFTFQPRQHKRLKIAYSSGDFRSHPVGQLTRSLYGLHDRDNFEVYALSYKREDDNEYQQSIKNDCDHFIDVSEQAYTETAQFIYDEEIDIYIDMMGYTTLNRFEISLLKPAPIQVNYLGFPATVGHTCLDYILVDDIIVPEDQQAYFSEKLVHLPNCYMMTDDQQAISNKSMQRADYGLPEGAFVFACFSDRRKIEPEVFSAWMQILARVPKSVLWLKNYGDLCRQNLYAAASEQGIDPQRLLFIGSIDKAEHLATHNLVDLYLDTMVMNGHTTVCDSLWAGLPVLTCQGDTFARRVASSLLTHVGLEELITTNQADYIALAVELAQNPEKLAAIRQRLQVNKHSMPLYNTQMAVKHLEQAYQTMWDIYSRGESPRAFRVQE